MKNKLILCFIKLMQSVFAGVFISIGCLVYLNTPNVLGAILFSIGLVLVFIHKSKLVTGMFGILDNTPLDIYIALVGNMIGTFLIASVYKQNNALVNVANTIVQNKFSNSTVYMIVSGIICGMLITSAVMGYKVYNDLRITVLCVTAFIVMGADHCVANSFYLFMSDMMCVEHFIDLIKFTLGNACGSYLLAFVCMFINKQLNQMKISKI